MVVVGLVHEGVQQGLGAFYLPHCQLAGVRLLAFLPPGESVRVNFQHRPQFHMLCRVELAEIAQGPVPEQSSVLGDEGGVVQGGDRVVSVPEPLHVLCLDLVSETRPFRLLESVVRQRNHHLLPGEGHPVQLHRGVVVPEGVLLLVVDTVIEAEGEVILGLGHLHHSRIGHDHCGSAVLARVVIYHHAVHHSRLLVLGVDAQYIALDSVVEGTCGDVDFLLGAADVVPEGVNLVVCHRHQVIRREEGGDADDH